MTEFSIKKLLKQARECLAKREYREALLHCKGALAQDRSCSEAYIYVGKAAFHLQEHTKAEAAYQRVIDTEPGNILAWQGLAELYTDTGEWHRAATAYEHLANIARTSHDEALHGRERLFMRRQAEAHAHARQLPEAEACWQRLAAAAPESSAERLDCLCHLADVQLAEDQAELEMRVSSHLAEAASDPLGACDVCEATVRLTVEGEWAEEALELESDHACHTLREVISATPPAPRYAPYHDAYLRRLRRSIQAAPPASMQRHERRVAVLQACAYMMAGKCHNSVGGCCSSYAFEATLAMIEVENEVMAPLTLSMPELQTPQQPPLLLADSERVAVRLAHAFPCNALASVHLALSLRRRAVHAASFTRVPDLAGPGVDVNHGGTSDINSAHQPRPYLSVRQAPRSRRQYILKELLTGLRAGAPSASGWLAAADLLLEEGRAEAALDAAKQGLKYVAHRDVLGKERMVAAGLLLRLLASKALARMGALEQAQSLLESLAHGVSEGHVHFGEIAGLPPMSIHQQAIRYLAHVALARGDRPAARQMYDELVGRELMGRAAVRAEPWAHAELGWLLYEDGEMQVALRELNTALRYLQEAGPVAHKAALLADYHLKLGRIQWALGGEHRTEKRYAFSSFMSAASAAANAAALFGGGGTPLSPAAAAAAAEEGGPVAGGAFAWLGHWYAKVAGDEARTRKCYQKALALDRNQEGAGLALCDLLESAGQPGVAEALCAELATAATAATAAATASASRSQHDLSLSPSVAAYAATAAGGVGVTPGESPGAGWALRKLAKLQLANGKPEAAVATFQKVIREDPGNASIWEGLGAAYQALGRNAAATKAYQRALELQPGRLYSQLQLATLQYEAASYTEALATYIQALVLQPGHPVALLGASETLLASAKVHARMGALGAAAAELHRAVAFVVEACSRQPNSKAAYKQLGDVHLMAASLPPPPSSTHDSTGADPVSSTVGGLKDLDGMGLSAASGLTVAAAVAAAHAQVSCAQEAKRAYRRVLALDPQDALAWGDLAACYSQEARALSAHPVLATAGQVSALHAAACRLLRGGLRLDPANDWLWAALGTSAAAAQQPDLALAESAWSRALQLNPKRALVWAELGRLYATAGAGHLAEACFTSARTHEPTQVAVWEAMAYAAGLKSHAPGDAAHAEMMDNYVHAAGLGGDVESWLWVATDALATGGGARGDVHAAASKAAVSVPLLAAAQNTLGLAQEAAGDTQAALSSIRRTKLLLAPESLLATATAAVDVAAPKGNGLGAGGSSGVLEGDSTIMSPNGVVQAVWAGSSSTSSTAAVSSVVCTVEARLLAKHNQHHAALSIFDDLAKAGSMAANPTTRLAYALTLGQVPGRAAEEVSELQAIISAADSASPALLLSAGRTLVQLYLSGKRWDEALGVVLTVVETLRESIAAEVAVVVDAADMASSGGSLSARALQLWLVLLAGYIANGVPELVDNVQPELIRWTQEQPHLELGRVTALLHAVKGAHLASAGQQIAAMKALTAAVHLCPWDASLRTQLAGIASTASPVHSLAAARVAPQSSAPGTEQSMQRGAPPAPSLSSHLAAPSLSAISLLANPGVARATALTTTLADPSIIPRLRTELALQVRAIHISPQLLLPHCMAALIALQLAVAEGGACKAYRAALARCRVAVAMVQRERDAVAAAAATAASPPPAPAYMGPGLPMMQMMAAARNSASGVPTSTPAGHSTGPSVQLVLLQSLCVRLLAAASECHLHSRMAGGLQRAKETALEALRSALHQAGGSEEGLAHRQLGRTHAAMGDWGNARASYEQAARLGDVLAALELASSLAARAEPMLNDHGVASDTEAALKAAAALADLGEAGAVSPLTAQALAPTSGLASVAQLQSALVLLQVGGPEQFDEAKRRANGVSSAPWVAAAGHAAGLGSLSGAALEVVALAAVQQAEAAEEGGEERRKLALEARWAAQSALRLSAHPDAVGSLLLGAAQGLRGRHDLARAALLQALKVWPHPKGAPFSLQSAGDELNPLADPSAGSDDEFQAEAVASAIRTSAARVHNQPWCRQAWLALAAAA